MRDTFYKLTDPILDRIPDISHLPARRQVTIGIGASLLFHVLLLLFALVVGLLLPKRALISFAKSKPLLQEIELTVVPPEPETQSEARLVSMEEIQSPAPFVDSRGLNASEKAPENPLFESDVNMAAASELPGTGSVPLPTQEGRTDREFTAFSTQRVLLGKTALPFPADVSLSQPNAPSPATPAESAPPTPAKTAATAPLPMGHAEPALVKPPAPSTPMPKLAKLEKPERRAKPTPEPLKQVAKPREDEIAVANPPAPPEESSPDEAAVSPLPAPRAGMPAMRTTAPVAMQRKPQGYQPEQEKTRIEGSITNKGRPAVDAVGTPLARYKKAVYDAVGSRWYYYTAKKTDLIAPGSVRVSFSINEQGQVEAVKSQNNTSNPSFSDLCERAVRDAEIGAPPADLMEPLLDSRLDFTITFTFHTF
jgi:outer membrane biosynthesis protein TonB